MMSTLRKLIDGLTTRVYKLGLWVFFKTDKGREFSETYGLSFNPDISLSQMPIYFPSKEDFYRLAPDLNNFEIVKIDEDKLIVTIREICTDFEHDIGLDLFDTLFVKIEKPSIDEIVKSAKS